MRAKPEMKPWVRTDKSRLSSVGAALSARVFDFVHRSAAPLVLNKCVPMINPGLAPWAMQEYRPYRAFLRHVQNQCQYVILVVVSTRTY